MKNKVALVTGASSGIGEVSCMAIDSASKHAINKRYLEVVLKAATAARPKLRYPVGRVSALRGAMP